MTTSSGTSSPFWVFGAYLVDFDPLSNGAFFQRLDLTGNMALALCALIDCDTGTEKRNGAEVGDGWGYVDGLFIPRYDFGAVWNAPIVGGLGLNLHVSGAGTSSTNQDIAVAGLDFGLGGAHAFALPGLNVTGLTTATYAWGFMGDSQTVSGRAFKVMTDVVWRFSDIDTFIGYPALSARFFLDKRTDEGGGDAGERSLDATFVGFGLGIGFTN